jgi:hypothetical protein
VYEHGVHGNCCEGIGHHHAVVQSVVLLVVCALVQGNGALAEVGRCVHCGTEVFADVVDFEHVSAFLGAVHTVVASANVELSDFRAVCFFL